MAGAKVRLTRKGAGCGTECTETCSRRGSAFTLTAQGAAWGLRCIHLVDISPTLTRELMCYDCAMLGKAVGRREALARFDRWAHGDGECPFATGPSRAVHFPEDRALWRAGPAKSALQLVRLMMREGLVAREPAKRRKA